MSAEENNNLDPQMFGQFMENQKRELALREKEIDLEREKALAAKETDQRQFNYAVWQLEATERDRQSERVYKELLERKGLKLWLAFVVAVALFLLLALWKDKDQMIIELVKVVAYGGSFGFGGYAWGRYKKKEGDE